MGLFHDPPAENGELITARPAGFYITEKLLTGKSSFQFVKNPPLSTLHSLLSAVHYYLVPLLTSSSIGMNISITMPPITTPMNTITIGSMTEVRPLTAVSTSWS